METLHFLEWFRRVFIEYTKSISGPKLLILDGHDSDQSVQLVELAQANDVHPSSASSHHASTILCSSVRISKGWV